MRSFPTTIRSSRSKKAFAHDQEWAFDSRKKDQGNVEVADVQGAHTYALDENVTYDTCKYDETLRSSKKRTRADLSGSGYIKKE